GIGRRRATGKTRSRAFWTSSAAPRIRRPSGGRPGLRRRRANAASKARNGAPASSGSDRQSRHSIEVQTSSIDGVIHRYLEREKAGAQSGKSEHHQGDCVDKKRFVRAFAAALPTLGEEQHTADGVNRYTANRQDRPRQIPLHLPSTSLHMAGTSQHRRSPRSGLPLAPSRERNRRSCLSDSSAKPWSTALPRARSSSVRQAWSRNLWKTRSMPGPGASIFSPMAAAAGWSASLTMARA